jgi:hypothetical protein
MTMFRISRLKQKCHVGLALVENFFASEHECLFKRRNHRKIVFSINEVNQCKDSF